MYRLLVVLLLFSLPSLADEPGRRYDEKGAFAGTYKQAPDGSYRLYGPNNEYQGSVYPSRRAGSFRAYDNKGRFAGVISGKKSPVDGTSDKKWTAGLHARC